MKTISKHREIAIIVCGHGSNNLKFRKDFDAFIYKIKNKFSTFKVSFCFIEINSPSIEDSINLHIEKHNKIIFVPALLFKGKHYTEDIIEKTQKIVNNQNIQLLVTKGIELSSELVSCLSKEIGKKIKLKENNLLITISSRSSAIKVKSDLRKYTLKLSESLEINNFISGSLDDEEGLFEKINKKISNDHFSNIVLHPLFLFDGFLYQSTKEKFQAKYKKLLITKPILRNNRAVQAFIKRVDEKICLFK